MNDEYSCTKVYLSELDCENFSDMSFWEKFIPEGAELHHVSIYFEPGMYDEPDDSHFWVSWRKK